MEEMRNVILSQLHGKLVYWHSRPSIACNVMLPKLRAFALRCMSCGAADLRLYTRKVEVARDRIPNWPHEKLSVLAEQPSIFYDLLTPELLEQVCTLTGCPPVHVLFANIACQHTDMPRPPPTFKRRACCTCVHKYLLWHLGLELHGKCSLPSKH